MSTPAETESRKKIDVWREKLQGEIEAFYLRLFDEVAESDLREGDIARLSQALLRSQLESIKELQKKQ
ncbi:MAG: hypothetical protein AAGD25_28660 [Cyanobacteria bacterium P01_F01_bin.150]